MWVPSPETRGKFIAMTFDATGKVVPGGGIVANTVESLILQRLASIDAKLELIITSIEKL